MSGAGAAVGLILGRLAHRHEPGPLRGHHRRLAADVPHQRPDRPGRGRLAPRVLAESEAHPGELDFPGALTGTFGLLGVVYGLSRAATEGWTDTWTMASLVVGVLLLVAFGLIEARAPAAAVPDLPEPHPRGEPSSR